MKLIDFDQDNSHNISQIFKIISVGSRIIESKDFISKIQIEIKNVWTIINLVRK